MDRNPWLRALIILGVCLISVQLFTIAWDFGRRFGDIILIFFLAWLIAFLFDPVVDFLTVRLRLKRIFSVGAVYLGLLAILGAIGLLLIPRTASQVLALGHLLPQYSANTSKLVDDLQSWLSGRGISVDLHQATAGRDLTHVGQQFGTVLATRALTLAQSVLVAILDGVIVLVLSFYMMLDGPRISRALLQVTPDRFRGDVELLFASIDHSFGGYMRASLVLALVYAVGTGLAMYLAGIPFALPVSIFAGFMLVIPFVGDIVAVIPPLFIGLFTVSLLRVVFVFVAMVLLQQVVLQILRPKIMGSSVGLHPLWVLAAFLVGARAAGIWGALFSVPIAAIGQTVVQLYYFRAARNPAREGALARSLGRHFPHAPAREREPTSAAWRADEPHAPSEPDARTG